MLGLGASARLLRNGGEKIERSCVIPGSSNLTSLGYGRVARDPNTIPRGRHEQKKGMQSEENRAK
jgi:hypothetical protein